MNEAAAESQADRDAEDKFIQEETAEDTRKQDDDERKTEQHLDESRGLYN